MIFEMTAWNLVNTIIIAAGIGICGLSFMQISVSTHLRKEVRQYFQVFFLVLLLYISAHLARQLMDGFPSDGIRMALVSVTFVEILAAGVMAFMMSLLVLTASRAEKSVKPVSIVLLVLVCVHAVILIINLFSGTIYFFDSGNVYHRGPGYLLSNLCPLAMLVINVVLLIRYRQNMTRRVRSAFWIYMIAPIIAILIQSVFYNIQFIILATVLAAVYMFQVIIKDQTEKYEAQQLEASRLDTELSMATRIQADMLPNIFPAFPERDEFDIYASMTPAKEVGGDFYDFFLIDKNRLGLVIADVSGKGIPAALFMMISMILIQNYALTGRSPKDVLESVNAQICKNNREEMFVTVWFGILDLPSGTLTAASAGHEYPALKAPDGHFELFRDKHGIVIGALEGMKYSEYEVHLDPGAKLFVYTDGVAEATSSDKELYGTDRMIEALRVGEDGSPKEILAAVQESIDGFVKEAPQFDDLIMLCLRYNGPAK